ncbi:Protein RTA1 [Colletotrichum shisoi]|uniref:Protein RTA1 n=1 Tax=Colletotrichum shisoi TaxID=2078593 RepID=A0A5Q4BX77_9PEZI|nr:Protein RTA1 [Colletotrichum shisoi]
MLSASETPDWTLVAFVIETLFVLLAPALLAASIYIVLGRIIRLLDAGDLAWASPKWLTKLFVARDVISFITQLVSRDIRRGGILASADDNKTNDLGKYFILVGLAIQIIFFGVSFVVMIAFHQRFPQRARSISTDPTFPWRFYIVILYAVSALILVRSVFSVVGYGMGKDGELMSKELYIYIFDALLIFICVAIFNIRHPSRVVSANIKIETHSETGIGAA